MGGVQELSGPRCDQLLRVDGCNDMQPRFVLRRERSLLTAVFDLLGLHECRSDGGFEFVTGEVVSGKQVESLVELALEAFLGGGDLFVEAG